MGLFEKIFKPKEPVRQGNGYYRFLSDYNYAFSTWGGHIYESELVRAAIDARARHVSKLKIDIQGRNLDWLSDYAPNDFMTWSQFLYRVSTILDNCNNCFIVPVLDKNLRQIGFFPVLPDTTEMVEVDGEPWFRYKFSSGSVGVSRAADTAVLTKYQYKSDMFGSSNSALNETMNLLHIQNQGIESAVKNSSNYKFIAQLNNFATSEDIKKERERFTQDNLRADANNDGVLIFPNKYTNIKQIDYKPYTVDPTERKTIQQNVFNYFGVNEKILQNAAVGDEFDAFWNGAIEPFAIQFSEAMTKATFSRKQISDGAYIRANANRLQYMTTASKIEMAQSLGDRGMITINEIRELFNYSPIDGGDAAPIRGEYYTLGDKVDDQ